MPTGKHTLALNYNVHHIDPTLPLFHKNLLTAWLHHTNHHTRINPPVTLADILQEPLFRNPLIAVNDTPFYYRDWIKAGIVTIRDLCYSVIPGFMPVLAIHEILTQHEDDHTRQLHQTTRELTQLQQAIPNTWTTMIHKHTTLQRPTLQPIFVIPSPTLNTQPTPIENCKTRHFYHHFQRDQQTQLPALNHWQTLPNCPPFNHTFRKDTHPSLATNKQGDVNWKIVHRILPTALSLHRATVYHMPNCHRCHTIENLEHLFLQCPTSISLWTHIQPYIYKMTNNTLQLNDNIKLFGLTRTNNIIRDKDTLNLVNSTLTTARCAIHKSAVNYRTRQVNTSPQELFTASVKAHINFIYKCSKVQQNEKLFKDIWCIGSALASINDNKLVIHL